MTKSTGRGTPVLRHLVAICLLGLVVTLLMGCGSDGSASYTPPPATIIRAGDYPTAPPAAKGATASAAQPAASVVAPAKGGTTQAYPPVAVMPPVPTTPEPYPTK